MLQLQHAILTSPTNLSVRIESAAASECMNHRNLVKSNLGRGFCVVGVFVKGTIGAVFLLLDSGAELHELFGYGLVGCLEYVDQTTVWSVYFLVPNGSRRVTHDPESALSWSVKRVMAKPSFPARPVLPIL